MVRPSLALGFGLDNPADRADDKTKFEWVLPEVALQFKNNLINMDFSNADMTTDSGKKYFLSRMENGTLKMNSEFDLGTKISIGKVTFHTGLWSSSTVNVTDGFMNLIFDGYKPNRTYTLTGTRADGLLALSYDLSYARPIMLESSELQVGATVHILNGIAMYSGEVTSGTVTSDNTGAGHYQMTTTVYGTNTDNLQLGNFLGQGFLIDVGANYFRDEWKFGAVLKNLGSEMNWSGVDITNENYEGDITELTNTKSISPNSIETKETNISYSIRIPVELQLGATYSVSKKLALNFGLEKAFGDGWGYSTTMRLFGGANWLPFKCIYLAGEASWQGNQIEVDTLTQLRIWSFWLGFEAGWTGGLIMDNNTTGVRLSLSTRLHF